MMKGVNPFILLSIFVTFASCANDPKQLKDGDTIFFPDTVAFKQSWKMEEKVMRNDLFQADTFYNALGLDTFELSFRTCPDCPDWIDTSKLHLDCKECSEFYTDPADQSMKFPEDFLVNGNTVRFYGVRIPELGLPQYRDFGGPNPPMWTVIKYYGYEVIGPYKIWAPRPEIYDELNGRIEVPLAVTIQ